MVIKKSLHIVVLLLFIAVSQQIYGQSKTLRFDHLTTEDGLPRNQVYSLLQDKTGYVWVGAGKGLCRYDGYRFALFNNSIDNAHGEHIVAIYEDAANELWIGSGIGLSRFDRKINRFENFKLDSLSINDKKTFYVNKIIGRDENQLWIATKNGLLSFDKKTKKHTNNWGDHILKKKIDSSNIMSLLVDSKKRLWVGTKERGVFLIRFTETNEVASIDNFKHTSEKLNSLASNEIADVKEDNNGVIWFATYAGLCKLLPEKQSSTYEFKKIQNPFKESIRYSDITRSITVDSQNNLYVGYVNGVYKLPVGKNVLETVNMITDHPLLKHEYDMYTQFIDDTGVLWATSNNGIYKHDFNQLKFKAFRANQDKPISSRQNLVWSLLKDQEKDVWIGTSYGLNKLIKLEKTNTYDYLPIFNNAQSSNSQKKHIVRSILALDKDNMLISQGKGLFKFNKKRHQFTKIDYPYTSTPNQLSMGANNIVWMGTTSGIVKYDLNTQKFKNYTLPTNNGQSRNNWVHLVYVDSKDRVWVGTSIGVNVFYPDEEKFTFIEDNSLTDMDDVWAINEGVDGTIWYGKWGGGLLHIKPTTESYHIEDGYVVDEYLAKDGLPNEYIYSIFNDEEGNLWMSSNMGIIKYNLKTELFESYTVEDGVQSNEFNVGAYCKTKEGEMLMGGHSGFCTFLPSKISKSTTVPNVVVSNVSVNDESMLYPNQETGYGSLGEINLNHDQNVLKFEYAALGYNSSLKNKYHTRLENYDESWVNMQNATSVTYSKLPPGNYTFQVKGSNSDGVWDEKITTIKINIKRPYWKTWWFYSLFIVFGLLVAYAIFLSKLKQVKLKEKNEYFILQNEEKKAVIKEIHHRIKNNLQVVISLLRMQASKVEDEKVSEMFKATQQRIFSMALIHEKMQQEYDLEHRSVQGHFNVLINDLVKTYAVGKEITVDVKTEGIDLGMQTLAPLGLIVNEIITNSLKYAFNDTDSGIIKVAIKKIDEKKYEMQISDNGLGLQTDVQGTGLGTKLIKIFTRQLNGSIEQLDQNGTAYRITFEKIDHT